MPSPPPPPKGRNRPVDQSTQEGRATSHRSRSHVNVGRGGTQKRLSTNSEESAGQIGNRQIWKEGENRPINLQNREDEAVDKHKMQEEEDEPTTERERE